MDVRTLIVFSTFMSMGWCTEDLTFPPGFLIGVATSSYQTEGAWNVSGKGESIWDRFVHNHPEMISDKTNGDIACDSYNQWQRDVDAIAHLGLDFYRFSISWARILPTGFTDHINDDAAIHYDNLIQGLLEKGIQPVVTIYHWDMPQRLQDLGGWANPLIADWFGDYARVLFSLYADRVKIWITINEPQIMCDYMYEGFFAPGVVDKHFGRYLCNKHVMLAHAKAWRIYDEEFRNKYKGRISIVNQVMWFKPKDENELDAAALATQMMVGRVTHPIYSKEGGWPVALREALAKRSEEQGYPFSRLPDFTDEEIELVKGTYDYFGFNYYTSRVARKRTAEDAQTYEILAAEEELDLIYETDPEWKSTASSWFKIYPEGLRLGMQWVIEEYGDMDILVTELGLSTHSDTLYDFDRVEFLKSHIHQMLLAIKEDKIKVLGFAAWSLIDDYEWIDGYQTKFGLYCVNFTDPKRPLTPRMSAKFIGALTKNRSLDVPDINITK